MDIGSMSGIIYSWGPWICTGVFTAFILWRARVITKDRQWEDKYRKLATLKAQSEVRLGAIGEHLSPFLENWPFADAKTFCPLGAPIDGINFGKDKITFIEIKTGGSRLSKSQKKVKELVSRGEIDFLEFRISDEGIKEKWTEQDAETTIDKELE